MHKGFLRRDINLLSNEKEYAIIIATDISEAD